MTKPTASPFAARSRFARSEKFRSAPSMPLSIGWKQKATCSLALGIPRRNGAGGRNDSSASPRQESRQSIARTAQSGVSPRDSTCSGAVYETAGSRAGRVPRRSEEHTSELQSRLHLVCRLLLEKKNKYL